MGRETQLLTQTELPWRGDERLTFFDTLMFLLVLLQHQTYRTTQFVFFFLFYSDKWLQTSAETDSNRTLPSLKLDVHR